MLSLLYLYGRVSAVSWCAGDFKGDFALPACLQCPQMPYGGGEIRAPDPRVSHSPGCLSHLLCLPGQVLIQALFPPNFPCSGVVSVGNGSHGIFDLPHALGWKRDLKPAPGLSSQTISASLHTQPTQMRLPAGRKGTALGLGYVGGLRSLLCCWVCPVWKHSTAQHFCSCLPSPEVPALYSQLDAQQPLLLLHPLRQHRLDA